MDLSNLNLLDLQSSYMQNDSVTKAMCEVLNPYYKKLNDNLKLCFIYSRIDELDDAMLDELAWQFSVDWYEATLNIEKKRALIKNAFKLHRIKGTPEALLNVVTTIFGRTLLKEWWEYGGKPYFFKLDIDITEQGASKENLEKLDDLIQKYKNVRSWVDVINIFLACTGKLTYAVTTNSGEEITVYPWSPQNISSKGMLAINASVNSGIETVSIYPKKEG